MVTLWTKEKYAKARHKSLQNDDVKKMKNTCSLRMYGEFLVLKVSKRLFFTFILFTVDEVPFREMKLFHINLERLASTRLIKSGCD